MLNSLYVIIIGLIVFWCYYRSERKKLLSKIKNIPDAAKHYPIIGVAHLLIGKSLDDLYNLAIDYVLAAPSTICKAFIFTKLLISVTDPKDIQKILTSPQCLDKATPYTSFPAQNGLISSKAALWRTHRKMLNPTFHPTSINKVFAQQFNEIAQHLVKDLESHIGLDTFDISTIISYRIIDLQLRINFDADLSDTETRTICKNNKRAIESLTELAVNCYSQFWIPLFGKLFKLERVYETLLNSNYKIIEPLIDKYRSQYHKKLVVGDSENDFKTEPEIFIHRLVTLGEGGYFTGQDIKDHANTILLAGSDSITVTLSNCILCLAMNPDVQEKCAIEIKEVIGDQIDSILYDDLAKLTLLDRTINESMRLIPTVSTIARTCNTDFRLDDNRLIPAGTDIIIPISVLHHSKEYWGDNPTKFNPDNFLPQNVAKRPLLSFIPFSYGIRNCVAKRFAQNALKIFIAHLLVNYKFSTDLKFEEIKLGYGLIMCLKNKHLIRLEKR